ncbi:MAG TPA: ParA family protein [Candidatus Acetothermia bacterium]|nr:ParA family protein [Candidatus Bipolaricaulota bacterium]RLA76135.1 MAG: ParA family protein [Deltaproteobacteria bacterium]HDI11057.1 ParA family protein [Candidatus Acetothermia bacterium]
MGMVYAVANQKGGVGKTTTCISLGAALVELEKRVLLVDLDPQGGLTTGLGFDPDSFPHTVYDALVNETPIRRLIVPTKLPGLELVPANLDLAGAEGELLGEIGWDRTLKASLGDIQDDYDFIFLDCPPNLGVLTINALMAARRAIVPVQTEYLALRGLKQLFRVIAKVRKKGNPELSAKILRTMHQSRIVHARETSEELEAIAKGRIYRTIIPRTVKFAEATAAGESILTYLPGSPGASAYRELAQEVLEDG